MFNLIEVANATNSQILKTGSFSSVEKVNIDSRKAILQSLFIAVKGEKTDGHEYIEQAIRTGAVALMISNIESVDFENPLYANVCILVSENTTQALGMMAAWWRRKMAWKVIAITGSCGKTSTRKMIYQVLSKKYPTGCTKGNFNNHIGLPLTILDYGDEIDYLILEMGMNHSNEIDYLAQIASPDAGVLTSIAPVHTENFPNSGIEGIINAKAELLKHLKPGAPFFWNQDDPGSSRIGFEALCEYGLSGIVISSGQNIGQRFSDFDIKIESNDFFSKEQFDKKVEKINFKSDGSVIYRVYCRQEKISLDVRLSSFGTANVSNSCLAMAVAAYYGIKPFKCIVDLEKYSQVGSRLKRLRHSSGAFIIDDTYNSNPFSLSLAVQDLSLMPCSGKKYLVMGDMLELGASAVFFHQRVIMKAFENGIDSILMTGSLTLEAARILESDYQKICTYFTTPEDIGIWLEKNISKKDIALFKASRGIGLEKSLKMMTF